MRRALTDRGHMVFTLRTIKLVPSQICFKRYSSYAVPKTLTDLENITGKLTYRSNLREVANFYLIGRLVLTHSVRKQILSKGFFKEDEDFYNKLINNSRYFNYRNYMYENFRKVDLTKIENFPNEFSYSGCKEFEDSKELRRIFSGYESDISFEDAQDVIQKVIKYLAELDQRPTYKLYEILIENFNKLGLPTVSNQIYDSITRLPGETTNFMASDNYLCEQTEDVLRLMLDFASDNGYVKDFRRLVELVSINGSVTLTLEDAIHPLCPATRFPISKVELPLRKDLGTLKSRFFPNQVGKPIYLKDGDPESISNPKLRFMSSDTCYSYLRAAFKLGKPVIFQLLLRKWTLNSVINKDDRSLLILVNGDIPGHLKSCRNLKTVEDYSVIFSKKFLKLVLKYCYTTKDSLNFGWILGIMKKVYLMNQHLYLKFTYPLGVIDNEIVSLIWLNCKNVDHEVYQTWVLLEEIFEMDKILEDYQRERFIALSCK